MARLHNIACYSSYKASMTLLLECKVFPISENVPDPANTSKSLVVLLNRSWIVMVVIGSLCVLGIIATMRQ